MLYYFCWERSGTQKQKGVKKTMKMAKRMMSVVAVVAVFMVTCLVMTACGGEANHVPAKGDIYKCTEVKATIAEADLAYLGGSTIEEFEAEALKHQQDALIKVTDANKVAFVDAEDQDKVSEEATYTIDGNKIAITMGEGEDAEEMSGEINGKTLVVKVSLSENSYMMLTYTLQ